MAALTQQKQEAFAQAVAAGVTGVMAYREHISARGTMKTATEAASRLLADPVVAARVAALRKLNGQVAEKQFKFSRVDALRWLLAVVKMPPGKANARSSVCEARVSRAEPYYVTVDKLAALKQIVAMCGWNHADDPAQKQAEAMDQLLLELRKR